MSRKAIQRDLALFIFPKELPFLAAQRDDIAMAVDLIGTSGVEDDGIDKGVSETNVNQPRFVRAGPSSSM